MQRIPVHVAERIEPLIGFLRELVECESPSDDPAAVRRCQELFAEKVKDIAETRFVSCGAAYGPALRVDFRLPGPRRKLSEGILAVGHNDTVLPIGTLARMPFRRAGGRLWGPGVLDMKGGLAFFVFAMRTLIELDLPVRRAVRLWIVPDEEIGSHGSRALTEKLALGSKAVLVPEPGTGLEGKLKTARKGIGSFTLHVRGKASHSGVDFSAGASAILELARQLERVAALTDLKRGITLNPGIVRGGSRVNVVAAEAEAEIDLRVVRQRDAAAIERRLRALKPVDRRCALTWTGGLNRPPMERTAGVVSLFKTARSLAKRDLGLAIEESATGGGSDGNFTAALGVPTLDGLGAVGEGAHAPHESLIEDRIADRTALLALLTLSLGQ